MTLNDVTTNEVNFLCGTVQCSFCNKESRKQDVAFFFESTYFLGTVRDVIPETGTVDVSEAADDKDLAEDLAVVTNVLPVTVSN